MNNMVAENNKHIKRLGSSIAAIIAIGLGLLLSPIARQYPVFKWITYILPSSTGLFPVLTPQPWAYTFEQLQQTDLRGQTALVTGANGEIGFEISRALSRQGASVTMACRNPQRCFAAVDRIRKEEGYSGAPISPLIMDVSDLKSVQRAAKTYLHHNEKQQLDMLFLNAGIVYDHNSEGATELPTSKDGIETTFATNVVGHHLLYRILEPALANSTMARVVSTSSIASIWLLPPYGLPHIFGNKTSLIPSTLEKLNEGKPSFYQPIALYGRSKLAQVIWSKALTRRLGDQSSIYANSAHPGIVMSPVWVAARSALLPPLPRSMIALIMYIEKQLVWTAKEGALTVLHLSVATDEIQSKDLRGRYFHPQSAELDHPHAGDEEMQENVWRLCEELVEGFL